MYMTLAKWRSPDMVMWREERENLPPTSIFGHRTSFNPSISLQLCYVITVSILDSSRSALSGTSRSTSSNATIAGDNNTTIQLHDQFLVCTLLSLGFYTSSASKARHLNLGLHSILESDSSWKRIGPPHAYWVDPTHTSLLHHYTNKDVGIVQNGAHGYTTANECFLFRVC